MKVSSFSLLLSLGAASAAKESWFSRSALRRFLPGDLPEERCEAITVDFDALPDGTALAPPLCVENEWEELGLTLFAEGGKGTRPCLFDTANPGSEEAGGDADLGAPNEGCTPAGPGVGEGGAPGTPGENCERLGNVLIVQEKGVDVPDDNADGGILTLDFPCPGGQYVYEIGLLDIDYATSVVVVYEKNDEGELDEYELTVPLLGDNSKQTLEINQDSVKWIKVMFSRSGAVTHVKFCPKEETPEPTPEPTSSVTQPLPPGTPTEAPIATGPPASAPTPDATGSPSMADTNMDTVAPTDDPTGPPVDAPTPDATPTEPAEPTTPPVDTPTPDATESPAEPTTSPVVAPTPDATESPVEPTSPPVESPTPDATESPTVSPTSGQTTAPPVDAPTPDGTCDTSGCCMEDCCGAGTKWNPDIEYCMPYGDSTGFDGTYKYNPDYDGGCVERTCCEQDCCYPGTVYDAGLECCVPK